MDFVRKLEISSATSWLMMPINNQVLLLLLYNNQKWRFGIITPFHNSSLHLPDRVQSETIRLINNPNLTNSLQSLSHRLVAGLSIFYRFFHGHCSQEMKNIIPDPMKRVPTTRSSTYSHPFQVTLPNSQTLAHKLFFILRTSQLWNSLPPTTFPESQNLSSFKSNIKKLNLVSLSTFSSPHFLSFSFVGVCYRPYGLSPTSLTKKKKNIRQWIKQFV